MSAITFDTHKFVKRLIDERLATKLDIAEVKAELGLVKWIVTTVLALAVANFAKQFF